MGPVAAILFLTEVTAADLTVPADRFQPRRGMNTEIWVEWLTLDEILSTPGFLEVYPDYPRHMPPDALPALTAAGYDFLRIAADPAPLLALAGTAQEAALLDQLRLRVEEAQAAGLKVVLDLHTFPAGQDFDVEWALADETNFAAYVAMAARVAARLDGLDPSRTALQLMNEPTIDCDIDPEAPEGALWPGRLAQLHAAARAAAPDLPLVLSAACWGGEWALPVLRPAELDDDNLLWSVHSYDPFLFTHQGADWSDEVVRYFTDVPYPPTRLTDDWAEELLDEAMARAAEAGSDLSRDDLAAAMAAYRDEGDTAVADPLQAAADWADAQGIPRGRVMIDEFGAMRDRPDGKRLEPEGYLRFLSDKRQAAEDLGFGWAIWSWRGTMGVSAAPDSYAPDPGVCDALGLPGC